MRVRIRVAQREEALEALARAVRVRRVRAVPGGVELELRARDFRALRKALRGRGARLHILEKRGCARLRLWARRHAALIMAGAVMLLLLYGTSNLVLRVEVSGEKDARQEREMRAFLAEMGLRPGVWAGSVDKSGIAEAVRRAFPGLSYAGVQRLGFGGMELRVVQAEPAPDVYDKSARVDVVAASGGLVTRVVTIAGEALVAPGDTVVPGQVLIRGTEEMPHAAGEVTARIWAEGSGEAPLFASEEKETGRAFTETYLASSFGRFPAEEAVPYASYKEEEEGEEVLGGLFYPLRLVRRRVAETEVRTQRRDVRVVRQEAEARALHQALEKLPGGASPVDKRVEYSMIEQGTLRAAATLEAVMQIGREESAAD